MRIYFLPLLKVTNLSHHAVPNVIDLFTVFTVIDQVKIVGKFDIPCNLLQDVYTEALAALLDVGTLGGVTAAHIDRVIEAQLMLGNFKDKHLLCLETQSNKFLV